MSEYWKSIPRKFCDFCKCWITDNKPSIDFHERGKRHQENVELRLLEVRKKSLQNSMDQEQLDKEMEKMEKAALEAFKKDLKDNPELAEKYGVSLEAKPAAVSAPVTPDEKSEQSKDKVKKRKAVEEKEWYEATSPEGYTYYWSTVTGESVWVAPDEFVSLSEQEAQSSKDQNSKGDTAETNTDGSEELSSSKELHESDSSETATRTDPIFSRSAYGSWSVVKEEVRPTIYNEASLPPELGDIPLPASSSEPKSQKPKFKEKTVTSLGCSQSGPVAFKKRKIGAGARNVRQKDNDD